jgi:hypothetical protein
MGTLGQFVAVLLFIGFIGCLLLADRGHARGGIRDVSGRAVRAEY